MYNKQNKKIKLLRVVTQSEVVPWHLKNFIDRSGKDYELFITGNGVSRFKFDYPYVTFVDNQILRKTSIYFDIISLIKLIVLCVKIRPKIIHSIMPKAGLLASIAGFITFAPIRIHTFTGQVWATKTGASREFYKFIDKVIFNLTTVCLTDSPSQSDFLAKNGFLVHGDPIQYLGKGSLSGVDLDKFDISIVNQKKKIRNDLGIGENDFVYVFLARKSITKGIKELIESFDKIAYLPNVKLLFIGPDESEGQLDSLLVKFANITDKIISFDIVKDHQRYLAISDVLCLPSSSEGFGSIVIEAAALGVPSIGFDIFGLSDSIEHNYSGILVPFKNVDKFAEAMISLYNDTGKLEKMKVYTRERVVKYFSADSVYYFQKQFYETLINK